MCATVAVITSSMRFILVLRPCSAAPEEMKSLPQPALGPSLDDDGVMEKWRK